jgi:hypothetical protein
MGSERTFMIDGKSAGAKMAIVDFQNRNWLIEQLKICSIRSLAIREGIKPSGIRYWIKKHNLSRSSIHDGMIKESAKIAANSKSYWSNRNNRDRHSTTLKITQSTRKPILSEIAINNWKKYRDNIIKGIKRASTPIKARKISDKLKEKWTASLQDRTNSFVERATNRHGLRFSYNNVKYNSYFVNVSITCNNCKNDFQQTPSNHLRGSGCLFCSQSQGQYEICDSIGGDYKINDRESIAPLEIDILYKSQKLGIEFHGMFWHSCGEDETIEDRLYHQHKWAMATNAGIHLLQFFEHEWLFKRDIVISMINHRLGKSHKINARSLNIRTDINPTEFYNLNHLQGGRHAKYHFCLMDKNEIMMAASLSAHQSSGFELIRMASKLGTCVRGGMSKLFSYIKLAFKGHKIITYADLRHADAVGYKHIGFIPELITKPGYFYCKGVNVLSRQQCQKRKLQKLLPNFDNSLSESKNMFNNGYRRMWDAGHMRLSLLI